MHRKEWPDYGDDDDDDVMMSWFEFLDPDEPENLTLSFLVTRANTLSILFMPA